MGDMAIGSFILCQEPNGIKMNECKMPNDDEKGREMLFSRKGLDTGHEILYDYITWNTIELSNLPNSNTPDHPGCCVNR